jgi:hypothetical protein
MFVMRSELKDGVKKHGVMADREERKTEREGGGRARSWMGLRPTGLKRCGVEDAESLYATRVGIT